MSGSRCVVECLPPQGAPASSSAVVEEAKDERRELLASPEEVDPNKARAELERRSRRVSGSWVAVASDGLVGSSNPASAKQTADLHDFLRRDDVLGGPQRCEGGYKAKLHGHQRRGGWATHQLHGRLLETWRSPGALRLALLMLPSLWKDCDIKSKWSC